MGTAKRQAKHLRSVESIVEPIDSTTVEEVAYDGSLKSFKDMFPETPIRGKKSITIDENDLKIAWTEHGLPLDAYLYFVFKFEGESDKLDPQDVADRWSAETSQGKLKELRPDQVEKAMIKIRKYGAIEYRQTVIDFKVLY